MKRIVIFSAILFAMFTFNLQAQGMYRGVSGYFYSELVPYGSWIEIDRGVVVWRPTIIRTDWMPYTMGRWIWTYDGWYWDSYEPFGYITFHYGRWFYDDYYGWLWYPDYEWAPAWVEWRYDNDFIGWAPLNPYAIFSISVGIHFTTVYTTPYYHWQFVRYNRFCDITITLLRNTDTESIQARNIVLITVIIKVEFKTKVSMLDILENFPGKKSNSVIWLELIIQAN